MKDPGILVTTGADFDGYVVTAHLGIVVRSPSIGQGFRGAFSSIFGGNISAYAEVCESARQDAFDLMVRHAREMGANGILAMRYDATESQPGVTEVLAYGTAVQLARR